MIMNEIDIGLKDIAYTLVLFFFKGLKLPSYIIYCKHFKQIRQTLNVGGSGYTCWNYILVIEPN